MKASAGRHEQPPDGPVTLVAAGGGSLDAYATLDSAALPAGSYGLGAVYPGDGTFQPGSTMYTINISNATIPAFPENCPVVVTTASGAPTSGGNGSGQTASQVAAKNGAWRANAAGVGAAHGGRYWAGGWSWSNATGLSDGLAGGGAAVAPHLVQLSGNTSVALATDAGSAQAFDLLGADYRGRNGDATGFAHDTSGGEFRATDGEGRVFAFYDFSSGTPAGRAGRLKRVEEPGGDVTQVTSWDSAGRPLEVEWATGAGAGLRAERHVLTYVPSGVNAGRLSGIAREQKAGAGSYQPVEAVAYEYHDGSTAAGPAGTLRRAVTADAAGTPTGTQYYRYDSSGRMTYAFGPAAFERLVAALGSGVDALTGTQVADYARHRAGVQLVRAGGDPGGGRGRVFGL